MPWRSNAGGLVTCGCVGEVRSPGTSVCGTGFSTMGHTGLPVTRSNTYTQFCFVICPTASIFLPSTVIYRLLDIPDLKQKVDFSSLKYFLYGAAPMSVEKLKQAIEVIGPCMTGGYGQTEAPGSISYLPPDEHFQNGKIASDERLSSVGRPNSLVWISSTGDRMGPVRNSGELVNS